MKPERAIIAARPLASHCPELLGRGGEAADCGVLLARLGEALARACAGGLARLAGGDAPKVSASPPAAMAMAQLAAGIAPLAANSLFAVGGATLLASIEADVVLRLLDRAFGGRGQAPAALPEAFPLSAELLIVRLEAMLAEALAAAAARMAGDHTHDLAAIRPLRRDGNLAALTAYGADQPLHVILLDIEEDGGDSWSITLAFPAETLPALAGDSRAARVAAPHPPADPRAEPFAEVPLTISAVLVDMAVGFSRLAALRPGDVLPVAVARQVPLRVGGRTIAHGAAGAIDDRVAVQITKAF